MMQTKALETEDHGGVLYIVHGLHIQETWRHMWNSLPHSLESKSLRVQKQLDKLRGKKNKSIVTEHKSTVFD